MKNVILAIAISSLSIVACAPLANYTKNEQVSTYDEKALIVLESAYDLALDTVIRAGNAGLINQSQAQRILPLLLVVNDKVGEARALYDRGQAWEAGPIFIALAALTDALRAERLL